jgi:hypothetical protein
MWARPMTVFHSRTGERSPSCRCEVVHLKAPQDPTDIATAVDRRRRIWSNPDAHGRISSELPIGGFPRLDGTFPHYRDLGDHDVKSNAEKLIGT